jgi:hypothetical protein
MTKHYRDQNGAIHGLDNPEHLSRLPPGQYTELTQEEFLDLSKPTIQELAKRKKRKVQKEKVRVRDGGVIHNSVLYDTDDRAILAYTKLSMKMDKNPAYEIAKWKASDGVWVRMTANRLQNVLDKFDALEITLSEWQELKELEIDALLSAGEYEALDNFNTDYV